MSQTDSKNTIADIKKKRLIFSVTTGRSGTAYLTSVLGYAKNAHSYHEPPPEYHLVLRDIQTHPEQATRFLLEKKFPAILKDEARIYAETSHLICKGFLEPMLALGIVPDLIVHRRKPRDVSLSLYRMGTIPGRTAKGLQFYLSPEDPDVIGIDDWKSLSDYQLCFWYCIEMERRARRYASLFEQRGARIAETTLPGLKTVGGFAQLLRSLDLQMVWPAMITRLRFQWHTHIKVNQSLETKKAVAIPSDETLDGSEAEVFSKLDRAEYLKWFGDQETWWQ